MKNTKPPKVSCMDEAPQSGGVNGNRNGGSDFDDQRKPDFLDAAALKAMESQARLSDEIDHELRGDSALHLGRSGSVRGGPKSIRSNQSRKLLSQSPGKRRGKQAMERDETESVISSVSTHRSVKSSASLSMSWFRNVDGEKVQKSSRNRTNGGSAITAENLAILNAMNDNDQGKIPTPIERPQGRVGVNKQLKTPDSVNNDSTWWPKLF